MFYRFWSYCLWDIDARNIKNWWISKTIWILCVFRGWYLYNGSSKSNNPYHFLRELNKIFQIHVNILSKLWLIFCWHQPKIQKMIHFWYFNDHNLGSKHDNLTNDRIFSTYSLTSIRWYISFLHLKTFKIQFYGSLPSLPKMTLTSLLI